MSGQGDGIPNMSFKVGQMMTIKAVPKPNAVQFTINVGNNKDDIALCMNPRFKVSSTRDMVYNSYQNGKWQEELRGGDFPFNPGEEFEVMIIFTEKKFILEFPYDSSYRFPNRHGLLKYNYIAICGDVEIHGIEIH